LAKRGANGNKIEYKGNGSDGTEFIDGVIYEDRPTKMIDVREFRGEIEFKDVWFRYPTRLQ